MQIRRDKDREPPEKHCVKRDPDDISADNSAFDRSDHNTSTIDEIMQSGWREPFCDLLFNPTPSAGSTTSNRPTRARIGYP